MNERERQIYDVLTEPFSVTHEINNRTYVTGEQATSRLNDVLGWQGWSFRILSHGVQPEAAEVWVLGELTVHTEGGGLVSRQQFGSVKLNASSQDNLKGAATDALKKCASLIGVGLYLHEKEGNGAPQQVARPASAPVRKAAAPSAVSSAAPPPEPLPVGIPEPATQNQRNALMVTGRTMGWTADKTIAEVEDFCQAKWAELTKKQAGNAIEQLNAVKAGRVPANA